MEDRPAPNDLRVFLSTEEQFMDENLRPDFRFDELNTSFGELRRQGGRHHSLLCFPRSPVEREDAARPAMIQPRRELVQHFICGGIVTLPSISIPRRNR